MTPNVLNPYTLALSWLLPAESCNVPHIPLGLAHVSHHTIFHVLAGKLSWSQHCMQDEECGTLVGNALWVQLSPFGEYPSQGMQSIFWTFTQQLLMNFPLQMAKSRTWKPALLQYYYTFPNHHSPQQGCGGRSQGKSSTQGQRGRKQENAPRIK